jgi:hypothetical protein
MLYGCKIELGQLKDKMVRLYPIKKPYIKYIVEYGMFYPIRNNTPKHRLLAAHFEKNKEYTLLIQEIKYSTFRIKDTELKMSKLRLHMRTSLIYKSIKYLIPYL